MPLRTRARDSIGIRLLHPLDVRKHTLNELEEKSKFECQQPLLFDYFCNSDLGVIGVRAEGEVCELNNRFLLSRSPCASNLSATCSSFRILRAKRNGKREG